jgi:HEAT repeats
MSNMRKLLLASVVLAMLGSTANAGGFIGINIGVPIGGYYRPYYDRPYYGGYYYRPYPAVYVGPPAVIVQPAPVVETLQPQVVYPAPAITSAAPAPTLAPVPATTPAIRAAAGDTRQTEIDNCLAHLGNPDEKVRADMAIQLGRLNALRAVGTLETTLGSDRSPMVRESAARALGLIGARGSLTALERAAQGDEDRDVRHSAQFAAEVIRGNRAK